MVPQQEAYGVQLHQQLAAHVPAGEVLQEHDSDAQTRPCNSFTLSKIKINVAYTHTVGCMQRCTKRCSQEMMHIAANVVTVTGLVYVVVQHSMVTKHTHKSVHKQTGWHTMVHTHTHCGTLTP